uniref:Uncharacterized protein n=1 Tax=Kalanchoe fedtschenkoi TaxID=63787 RepID=A0A7N0U0R0_KALFE
MRCGEVVHVHGGRVCARGGKSCKALLGGAATLVSLMCLLLVVLGIIVIAEGERDGGVAGGGHVVLRSGALKLQAVEQEEQKESEEEDHGDHMRQYHASAAVAAASREVDINYMSKRRVPNGADPIHNRRAGKSRRPPGKT